MTARKTRLAARRRRQFWDSVATDLIWLTPLTIASLLAGVVGFLSHLN